MWCGLGADEMMLAPRARWLYDLNWDAPPPVWKADAFVRAPRSRLSARGLTRDVDTRAPRRLADYPGFLHEYR